MILLDRTKNTNQKKINFIFAPQSLVEVEYFGPRRTIIFYSSTQNEQKIRSLTTIDLVLNELPWWDGTDFQRNTWYDYLKQK